MRTASRCLFLFWSTDHSHKTGPEVTIGPSPVESAGPENSPPDIDRRSIMRSNPSIRAEADKTAAEARLIKSITEQRHHVATQHDVMV